MEERGQSNSTGQHKLILQNRKSGSFTGVTDVVNFDANEIILDTDRKSTRLNSSHNA